MSHKNPIEDAMHNKMQSQDNQHPGQIAAIIDHYHTDSNRLLGFLLDMSYSDAQIITCDAWKHRSGGVPRNCFVLVKLSPRANLGKNSPIKSLILVRITDAIPTPVKTEIQQTIFEIHKVQAMVDPLTDTELQWGALKASILGTYYDCLNENSTATVAFGSDVDTFYSPHLYEAYVPSDDDLRFLINFFVAESQPSIIGKLRYTETLTQTSRPDVPVYFSVSDVLGNRSALFGKTRTGKSNIIKVIADMVMQSGKKAGQIIFDPSGEYSYFNSQDHTSLFLLHQDRCVRYSLHPRQPERELKMHLPAPRLLRANFFNQINLGHSLIVSLYDTLHTSRPDYIAPLLAWETVDRGDVDDRFPDIGDRTRYLRSMSMYLALLHEAGFRPPQGFQIHLNLNRALRRELALAAHNLPACSFEEVDDVTEICEQQPVTAATAIYDHLYGVYEAKGSDRKLFPPSSTSGRAYFDPVQLTLLRMLGDKSISGAKKLTPFSQYHDPAGSNILAEIVHLVDQSKTVILDLSFAEEIIARQYSDLICKAILHNQVRKFAENRIGDHSVLFYFEEAHTLFRQDDQDLSNIYNKLAKEGGKFGIGMVYATQSMTTLSPDLLKNTENFFVTHLNDDREIMELSHKYEFRDVAMDVQRTRTKGFVRMITLSHRYALPVQIRKFGPPGPAVPPDGEN